MTSELFGLVFSIAFVAGVLGNLVASIIWASPAGLALARKLNRHHAEHLKQAVDHHLEEMAQAAAHHKVMRQQADRQHAELLDRADAHHEALKAHVSAAASSFAADLASSARKQSPRKGPA